MRAVLRVHDVALLILVGLLLGCGSLDGLRKKAEQGDAVAQRDLGLNYFYGAGVKRDPAEASDWLSRAADQGDTEAQYNLSGMYWFGEGVTMDHAEAVRWCRKAAEHGHSVAQVNLGYSYADGEGMSTDLVEAYKWWNLAAGAGITVTADVRLQLESRMTADQIAEAQRRSREFRPNREEQYTPVMTIQIPQ